MESQILTTPPNFAPATSEFDANAWMHAQLQRTEQALSAWVGVNAPANLGDAMRYAVLDGGKRLRPLLVLAAAQSVQGLPEAAIRAACAVELIHAYSLVHDDMPCMDNDVLRRGKPTVHVQFGESQALLGGDALQALAFELLTPSELEVPASVQAKLCRILAQAAGAQGMAGGQAIDLASVGKTLTEQELRHMHSLKTGALLEASVAMGVACAMVPAPVQQALARYATALGIAFQVVDDVLDVVADAATLGKTPGKDAANEKPTFVSLMGLDAARSYANDLLEQALAALHDSGLQDVRALSALAHLVVSRSH
ncbi:polyprenyl synthetase family protein [Comamonas jiangduensis]|uniref:polyprenyl synthetase family protein n=1 Tax=Comamonas jiangduensis TaxID=1194168 RepID=UPI003BF7812C